MKVTICWLGYSGYLASCWKRLCADPEYSVEIHAADTKYGYERNMLEGLPVTVYSENDFNNGEKLVAGVAAGNPDIVVVSGFLHPGICALLSAPELRNAKFIMAMDSCWRGTFRQFGARFYAWRRLKRFAAAIVAGERGRQYARYLGFSDNNIFYSVYGCDFDAFCAAGNRRRAMGTNDPHSFVYVGRYAHVKGMDVLIRAYSRYRELRSEAWPLHCYGKGELQTVLAETAGVVDHGFLQPDALAEALAGHGVMILPSHYEPWGVVVAEAAATGMPVICSGACCSGLDIVRHLYNGLTFAAGDSDALTDCLLWMHDHPTQPEEMGKRAQVYAGAYSAQAWSERWKWIFNRVMQ